MFKTRLFSKILPILVASLALCTLLVTALPAQQARAVLTGRPQLVNENIGFDSEAQPYVYDYKATANQTSTRLLVSFEGTAEYTVNGGSAISLTSGVESAAISLGAGTAIADRITKIVVTVNGDTNNSYLMRVFRMPTLDSVALRDKSGNAVTHTETQTDSFSFKEEASVGHSLSQLEFEITGSGWFHGWYGHQQISTMGWRDLNMAVHMLFQDGLNTYDFAHYPFRDDPALNGIGWGPNNTYKFEITREPAFGSGTMSSIAIPELSATCAASGTECQEISTSPGNYDIRALDSTRSITLNTTFTTGTAEYTVNGGSAISLTTGVASNTINLGSGTTNAARITTITVTHHGAFDSTYVLRVFRMPKLDSVALRDKSGNAVTHTETQTDSFSFKEEASVGHSLSQLEFEITGSGWFHGWYGHQQISTMGWRDLNMAVHMLFQDGLNTYDFAHYPFRDDPALNGIGWGPNNTYKFEITRAPAFSAPTNNVIPSISGGNTVGSTLNASPGSWSGSNQTYTYNWKRSGSANGSYTDVGSNSSSYNLTEADAGMFIKVAVVATANNLSSNPAMSDAFAIQALATTTTEPEIVTTTVPRPTTTVPRTTTTSTVVALVPSGGGGGTSDSGITPSSGTTAPVVTTTPVVSDTPNTTAAPVTTAAPTTTEPEQADEVTTTTVAVDVNAPVVPEVEIGSAVATINGEVVEVKITTNGNKVLFSAGGVSGELNASSLDGSQIQLDANGNLVLTPGDDVSLNLGGFGSETPVEVWMFSIPVKVKDMVADADGKTNGSFATPQGIDAGAHRIVVKGLSPGNDEIIIAVGVAVAATGDSSLTSKLVLPITAAVVALFIVALTIRLRRRSRLAI